MSEFVGSIAMRPICSDSRRPMFVHVLPPSMDLYTPSPKDTERWALFSPVPTHTTFGLAESMTTVPIEYDASLSNTGVHVVPALMVFHTPPDATATYQVFLSRGCTAMSATRPDVSAGPMERKRSPLNGLLFAPESAPARVVSV